MMTPAKRRRVEEDKAPMLVRAVRKYARKPFVPRNLRNQIHSFRRNASAVTIAGNVAYAPYQAATNISLSQVVNSSDFTNLYDQFRINYVVVKLWLKIDPSAQAATVASFPKLYWVRDENSSTVLSQNEMRERSDCKVVVMKPDRPAVMKFKPNVLSQNFLGTGFISYTPKYDEWIDTSSAGTFYYGALWNFDDLTNTNYKVDIETIYYLQCKNTR